MLPSGPRTLLAQHKPFIWALVPHRFEHKHLCEDAYDSEQTKTELAEAFHTLGLAWIWQPVTLENIDAVMEQIAQCRRRRETLVFNFCDGSELDGFPGVSVVDALHDSGANYTGARHAYYAISTSKIAMKECFIRHGVPTAPFETIPQTGPTNGICARVGSPVLVKPDISAASYGISLRSVVTTDGDIARRRDELTGTSNAVAAAQSQYLAERFIIGREFTVFVLGESDGSVPLSCLPPVERIFHSDIPPIERFLSYDRYWGYFLEESRPSPSEPFYHYELAPQSSASELSQVSMAAYQAVQGSGYGRVDIRVDSETGVAQVLEVNANCGLSSDSETTVGQILRLSNLQFSELLARIAEGALLRSHHGGTL